MHTEGLKEIPSYVFWFGSATVPLDVADNAAYPFVPQAVIAEILAFLLQFFRFFPQ